MSLKSNNDLFENMDNQLIEQDTISQLSIYKFIETIKLFKLRFVEDFHKYYIPVYLDGQYLSAEQAVSFLGYLTNLCAYDQTYEFNIEQYQDDIHFYFLIMQYIDYMFLTDSGSYWLQTETSYDLRYACLFIQTLFKFRILFIDSYLICHLGQLRIDSGSNYNDYYKIDHWRLRNTEETYDFCISFYIDLIDSRISRISKNPFTQFSTHRTQYNFSGNHTQSLTEMMQANVKFILESSQYLDIVKTIIQKIEVLYEIDLFDIRAYMLKEAMFNILDGIITYVLKYYMVNEISFKWGEHLYLLKLAASKTFIFAYFENEQKCYFRITDEQELVDENENNIFLSGDADVFVPDFKFIDSEEILQKWKVIQYDYEIVNYLNQLGHKPSITESVLNNAYL